MIEEIRDYVRLRVATGRGEPDDIITDTVDYFEDQLDPVDLEELVPGLVEAEWLAHVRAQESWPSTTDCDRLDAAFRDLERDGIVARQDFTCCRTCAQTEIRAELTPESRGYVYYHHQDTERAADGGELLLGYGGARAPITEIGHTVCEALMRHGLAPQWNGDPDVRISIKMSWQRRRPAL